MKVSAGIYPTIPVRETVEVARALDGICDTLWVGDSHLIWRECWTTITAAAAATHALRFGPCVSNPISRDPSLTASIVATLQELTGGRIRLGLGVGDSALRMTRGSVATIAELRSAVEIIRMLLETGRYLGEERELELSISAPDTEIYLSGSGPRTLEASGELGDGAIIVPGINPNAIAQVDSVVERGAMGRTDGRSPRRMLWAACSIRDDRQEALDDVRPFVASVLRHPLAFEVSNEIQNVQEHIRRSYEFGHHMAKDASHADVVPDHVVQEFALAGTEADVVVGLEDLRGGAVELDEVALVLMNPNRLEGAKRLRSALSHSSAQEGA